MNVSIDTALFGLETTIDQIGSNITTNFILLNNSITVVDNSINTIGVPTIITRSSMGDAQNISSISIIQLEI